MIIMTKYNGFTIKTGTYIDTDAWFAIARHPEHKTIVTDHWDCKKDAIEIVQNLIDVELGLKIELELR